MGYMSTESSIIVRRWYDSRPPVRQALALMPKFPPAFQTVMADGLLTIADSQYRAEHRLKELKMLGTRLVMALYKANQRQRKADRSTELFQLSRYLLVLPPDKSDALGHDMLRLMTLIARYIKAASVHKTPAEVGLASEITNVFTYRGEAIARKILDDLERQPRSVDTISELPAFSRLNDLSAEVTEDRLIAIQTYQRRLSP
jgi:hypothetical protein